MSRQKQDVFTLKKFLSPKPTATTRKHAFNVDGRIPVFTTRNKAQRFLDIHAPGNEKRIVNRVSIEKESLALNKRFVIDPHEGAIEH
jgi:hypothetical protein